MTNIFGQVFTPHDDQLRKEAFIPPFRPENHAANIISLKNGDLLCAWFSGSHEGTADVRIVQSRLPVGASEWSQPEQISAGTDRSEQNPVLFEAPDNNLWLIYTSQSTRGMTRDEWQAKIDAGEAVEHHGFYRQDTAQILYRTSQNGGINWNDVQVLNDKPGAFCRQPPIVLSNGDWLLPLYYSITNPERLDGGAGGEHYSVMWLSQDHGETWDEIDVPDSRGRVQASVNELEPGKLVAFFRSRFADFIYVCRSGDYGRTWTTPTKTSLPNNNASIQSLKLQSGRLAMVYNAFQANTEFGKVMWPSERYPLVISLSEDGGETWPYARTLDHSSNFMGEANIHLNLAVDYPSICQSADGQLHIAYSYHGRQCIKYVSISEDWIISNRFTLTNLVWGT